MYLSIKYNFSALDYAWKLLELVTISGGCIVKQCFLMATLPLNWLPGLNANSQMTGMGF
jgi:hypothetical protein